MALLLIAMSPAILPLRVLKFGGTSVGDATRIAGVVEIVRGALPEARLVVVVSAMSGVTTALAEAAALAAASDPGYRAPLGQVAERHRDAARELSRAEELPAILDAVAALERDLGELLHGASLVRECTPRTLDSILARGELTSSILVAAALRRAGVDAEACDARRLVVTDTRFGNAAVDFDASRDRMRAHFGGATPLQVVTGFIGATPAGETTTLGRGGSDYTASLVGAILEAERVEIWTDVDGVMSADPRLVPNAFSIPSLTYDELLELSHFGAKVVHAPSVRPVREHGVPLVIRNTLHPDFPGTLVSTEASGAGGRPVRGISSIPRVALLRLEGDGMVGVPGIAERLFRALARGDVNVILISQASSEHSICFAVGSAWLAAARREVEEEFRLERRAGLVDDLFVEADCTIIAAVGAGMRDTPGIAGRLFSILGRRGINVRAIAQGSSELNVSLVVAEADAADALRALHDAVVAPEGRAARVYLAGMGGVGQALLGHLARAAKPELQLAGVATSRRMLCRATALDPERAVERLAADGVEGGGGALADEALADDATLRIFVDCTTSDALTDVYPRLLASGAYVVAANKRGFSGTLAQYRSVRSHRRARSYLDATVGAGLPLLRTVEVLRSTGDRIVSLEGALSGTLTFLFDRVMEGTAFSEALADARARGYTEPDPRDDLSGMDVGRKLLILGREMGRAIEPDDVTIEPVLPGDGWPDLGVEAFMERVGEVDGHFEDLRARAAADGMRLCYVASIVEGRAAVGLRQVGPDHPCYRLGGTDNLVAMTTERYLNPLVIRGAGAGRDVTGAGVLADILRCVAEAGTA